MLGNIRLARTMYETLFGGYDRVNLDLSNHASRNTPLSFLWRRSFIRGDSLRFLQSDSRDCDLPDVFRRDVRGREILLALRGEGKP
jgi:hypothetical protein